MKMKLSSVEDDENIIIVSAVTLSLALNKVSMVHFVEIPFSMTRLLENI